MLGPDVLHVFPSADLQDLEEESRRRMQACRFCREGERPAGAGGVAAHVGGAESSGASWAEGQGCSCMDLKHPRRREIERAFLSLERSLIDQLGVARVLGQEEELD